MDDYAHKLFAQVTLFIVPIIIFSIKFHFQKKKARKDDVPKLPPGPWQLPVIGSLHHLLAAKNPRLIHRTLTELARRRDDPVMYVRLGELPVVVVSSPAAAEEVMRTHDTTFAGRAMSRTMRAAIGDRVGLGFLPYGDRWRRLRKVCTVELLSARRVLSLRPVREVEAARLVAGIAAAAAAGDRRPPVNVSKRIAGYIADTALRAVMGERFRWRDEFLETMDRALKSTSGFSAGDLFPSSRLACAVGGTVREVMVLREKVFDILDREIDRHHERKSVPDDDAGRGDYCLLDALLKIQKEDEAVPMTTIAPVILEMFSGGGETTSTTLQWAMSELMRNPKVMHKAQEEVRNVFQGKSMINEEDLVGLKYLKNVIKETLRLHPATPLLIPRECREACNILGYNVPKGTMVIVNAWAIGRDPKYWDDAEIFRPERFEGTNVDFRGTNFELIPFGAGRRICPGITFAHVVMELALAMLLYHFDWQLPSGVKSDRMDMAEEFGVTVKRKNDLYLHPILRVPLEATV